MMIKKNSFFSGSFLQTRMLIAAIVMGIVAGFIAVGVRYLITLIHNVCFNWHWRFTDSLMHYTPPSFWGWAVIFVPVYGAMVVSLMVRHFVPEPQGPGLPESIASIRFHQGRVAFPMSVVKTLASCITIGTGGSTGHEGPIAQLSAAVGSFFSRYFGFKPKEVIILVACGASAGMAGTFNAPLVGVCYGLEIMLLDINAKSLFPVAIAGITAAYIDRFFFPANIDIAFFPLPHLITPGHNLKEALYYLWFIPFGLLTGVFAWALSRGIYYFEDLFNKLPLHYMLRHMLGMLMVGGVMELCFVCSGHYYVEGIGFATVAGILQQGFFNPLVLYLLSVAKWFVTCATLGSGAAGGVLSPSLFIGAAFGYACGICLNTVMPALVLNPVVFALAGMAAMVGATTGGVLTGILLVLALCQNPQVTTPLIISTVLAYAMRYAINPFGVYTFKLKRRNLIVEEGLHANHAYKKSTTTQDG